MPAVSTLLAELETKLKELYPSIRFGLGEKDLARQDLAPPRIIWIPTTAKHTSAEKQKTNPRRLLTRAPSIVAHCWAADTSQDATPMTHYDACEALVHNLIVALHKSAWGSIEMGGEEWGQSDHANHGHVALVTFIPKVPVVEQAYVTVQATQLQPQTVGSVAGDSNVDWGEP